MKKKKLCNNCIHFKVCRFYNDSNFNILIQQFLNIEIKEIVYPAPFEIAKDCSFYKVVT